MKPVLIALAISVAVGAASALAQQPIKSATVDELVEMLAPPPAPPAPLTRSMTARNIAPAPRKIDLTVNFGFDSARLESTSKPLLLDLARAMGVERLAAIRFKVEGHTDAVGKADYNQQLSAKRAQSVLEFLAQSGVNADRLMAEGKGPSELLMPDRPDAPQNRRVRISTID